MAIGWGEGGVRGGGRARFMLKMKVASIGSH